MGRQIGLPGGQRFRTRGRRAFTLVEILFVVLIILILMGLLLVALQAAMKSSRRAACQKNFGEIGRSLANFQQQFDGRSAGTIANTGMAAPAVPMGNPPYGPTGGIWTLANGLPATPYNIGAGSRVVGMQGWDGYMGYLYDNYAEEVRRMWYCSETIVPYSGNVEALGRQTPVPKFRSVNYTSGNVGLLLGTEVITSFQNRGKLVVAYDLGIGFAGEGGQAEVVDASVTDMDDGGYPGMTPTAWGYMWFSRNGTDYLEGPHQRSHIALRADGSADQIREPANPLNPAIDGDLVTNPADAAQEGRQFTRFPRKNTW